jgi:4-amino-4-deoxy-L-arabinose transferase-like glycosyltransferase
VRTRDAGLVPRRQGEAGVLALWWVLAVVVLKCALTFAVADRYGWHIDELYYAVAGRHLQGGYVEFPPVTALLAALARVLFGWSLVGLRAFTILAGAGTALVGVLVARELGASGRAQKLAAIVVAFCPGMLATNWLFQPVAFDQLTTMIVLWLAVRLARDEARGRCSVSPPASDWRRNTRSRSFSCSWSRRSSAGAATSSPQGA